MSVPWSNYEGTISIYVFGKSFCHFRDLKCDFLTSQHLFCEKNIKLFRMCGGSNTCRNVKCILGSHIPEDISTNMLIGNHIFVFKYPVNCKEKFPNFHCFN